MYVIKNSNIYWYKTDSKNYSITSYEKKMLIDSVFFTPGKIKIFQFFKILMSNIYNLL